MHIYTYIYQYSYMTCVFSFVLQGNVVDPIDTIETMGGVFYPTLNHHTVSLRVLCLTK